MIFPVFDKKLHSTRERRRGVTLVELLIVVGIIGFVMGAVTVFFTNTRKSFTFFEVTNQLKTNAQKAVNSINHYLAISKRIFENNTNDLAYAARLTLSITPMPGTRLPVINETGSLSPDSPDFSQSSVGNCLFFASSGSPLVIQNVLDGTGTPHTMRIDYYTFNFYYLTADTSVNMANKNKRFTLISWHSKGYADWGQLNSISDATLKINTLIAIYNSGIIYAWNTSQVNSNAAFYEIGPGGSLTQQAAHTIPVASAKELIKITTGIMGWTFKYGVAFNTDGTFVIKDTVPRFASVNGNFPGGFETLVTGPNSSRQVFVRLVLMAQSAAGLKSYEQTCLAAVRDLW